MSAITMNDMLPHNSDESVIIVRAYGMVLGGYHIHDECALLAAAADTVRTMLEEEDAQAMIDSFVVEPAVSVEATLECELELF